MDTTVSDNSPDSDRGNGRPILRIQRRSGSAGQAPEPQRAETAGEPPVPARASIAARIAAATASAETSQVSGATETTPRVNPKARAEQSARAMVEMADFAAITIAGPSAGMTSSERGLITTGAVGLARKNTRRTRQIEEATAPLALTIGCIIWIGRIVKTSMSGRGKQQQIAMPEPLAENWQANEQPEWTPEQPVSPSESEIVPNGAYDAIKRITEIR